MDAVRAVERLTRSIEDFNSVFIRLPASDRLSFSALSVLHTLSRVGPCRPSDPAAFGGDPADAFEVIVPSLPGFGYSTPTRPDINFWKIADVWHELMPQTLGHTRYAAASCDVGALITGQLGHKYAAELYGIHIGSALKLDFFTGDRAWDFSGGRPIPPGLPDDHIRG